MPSPAFQALRPEAVTTKPPPPAMPLLFTSLLSNPLGLCRRSLPFPHGYSLPFPL